MLVLVALATTSCGAGGGGGSVATDAGRDPASTGSPAVTGDVPAAGTDGRGTAVGGGNGTGNGDGSASTDPTTGATTTLAPAPSADLPTGPPPDGATSTTPATAATGPLPIPTVGLVTVGEFDAPVGAAVNPLDPRLFVVEQGGRVWAIDDESTSMVLDLSDATDGSGERGLLGLAFHPDRDLAYVNYTDERGDTVIAEFAVDPATGIFDQESQRELLAVEQPFRNHNGGALAFGPDGLLYIGLGDGGAAGDPDRVALDLSTPLGKLLRIDPIEFGDEPFVVPDDNPFVGVEGADPTIWAYGLRNPWRISFDAANGDLWIADVGQARFEEVDRAPATGGRNAGRGSSFGWSAFEGNVPFNTDQPADGHTAPVLVYPHADGNCSVSGGIVVRDSAVPQLDGWYVFGDYCSGQIWGYDTTTPPERAVVVPLATLPSLTAVVAGPGGEVYAVSNAGTVARFTPNP